MKIMKIVMAALCLIVPIKASDQPTPPISFASESPIPGETDWRQHAARFYRMLEKQKQADFFNLPENKAIIQRKAQRLLNEFKQHNEAYLAYLRQNLNPRNWDQEKEKILRFYQNFFLNPRLSRAELVVSERIFDEFSILLERLFTTIFRESRVTFSEKE